MTRVLRAPAASRGCLCLLTRKKAIAERAPLEATSAPAEDRGREPAPRRPPVGTVERRADRRERASLIAVSFSSGARPSRCRARSVAPRIAARRSRSPSSASAAGGDVQAERRHRLLPESERATAPRRRPAGRRFRQLPIRRGLAETGESERLGASTRRGSGRTTGSPGGDHPPAGAGPVRSRSPRDRNGARSARPRFQLRPRRRTPRGRGPRPHPAPRSPTPVRLTASDPGIDPDAAEPHGPVGRLIRSGDHRRMVARPVGRRPRASDSRTRVSSSTSEIDSARSSQGAPRRIGRA